MGTNRIILAVAILAAAGVIGYLVLRTPASVPPPPAPVAQVKPPPAPEPPPAEHYPVPEPPAATLPALDASDAAMQEAFAGLLGSETLRRFFKLDSLVRHLVVTIDNLPRRHFAQRLSPVKPVGGLMATSGKGEGLVVAPENAARYTPWVSAFTALDAKKAVAIYLRFQPLFQQAYVELGYPKGHFNTRLVQVIDHLITAPEPVAPIRLTVPKVLYEYADPAMEGESSGRKILFRIGNANAAKVKAKLREIRRELVASR
jgi:hypothetical protein